MPTVQQLLNKQAVDWKDLGAKLAVNTPGLGNYIGRTVYNQMPGEQRRDLVQFTTPKNISILANMGTQDAQNLLGPSLYDLVMPELTNKGIKTVGGLSDAWNRVENADFDKGVDYVDYKRMLDADPDSKRAWRSILGFAVKNQKSLMDPNSPVNQDISNFSTQWPKKREILERHGFDYNKGMAKDKMISANKGWANMLSKRRETEGTTTPSTNRLPRVVEPLIAPSTNQLPRAAKQLKTVRPPLPPGVGEPGSMQYVGTQG